MSQPKRPTSVLIVDDDDEMIALQTYFLRGPDFLVDAAKSGLSGLRLANSLRPDVVLLDLSLPEGNGLTCLKTIRRNPIIKNTGVIVITGQDEDEWREKAEDAGADYYLTKPITKPQLLAAINSVLTRPMEPTSPQA